MKGFTQPEKVVLPEAALVPSPNVVTPPPNYFTHQTLREAPYFFSAANNRQQPDGVLPAGAHVTMVRCEDGGRCRVIDQRGLYVQIDRDHLKTLQAEDSTEA